MRIEAFVLYHRDGERVKTYELAAGLNLITGWRNTGKSSILDIVSYCFGKDELEVANGPIRDAVGWYGLVLSQRGRFAFSGRPAPKNRGEGTSDAMWLSLVDATPPPHVSLGVNTTTRELRAELSAFSDFAEYRFDPPPGAFREPLQLHVGHVLPACLQDEEDIDSRTHLFHRHAERDVRQALRDALPYWLGAAEEKAPANRFRLSEVNRELAHSKRTLERIESAKGEADSRGLALLSRAAEVGLVEPPGADEAPKADTLAEELRRASVVDVAAPGTLAPSGEVERLLAERRRLHERLSEAERDESLLRGFASDRDAFGHEISEQHARLTSIGLLGHDADVSVCPACARELTRPDPSIEQLASHLAELDSELDSVAELEPRDQRALEEASKATRQIRRQLQAANSGLREITAADESAVSMRELGAKQAFVQGTIAEYLRTLAVEDPGVEERVAEQIARLEAEKRDLERAVDAEGEEERLKGAVNIIGAQASTDVEGLSPPEAIGGQVRLDLGKMTLMIDTHKESFPLSRLGGAGTRVGYHLAAHFALHRVLRERRRPGPSFLLLDQPTGPFYPQKSPLGVEPKLKREDDQTVVDELFRFIRTSTEALGGELQVLVLDHFAAFEEPWFDEALVDNWRDGKGLLPADWL